MAAKYLSSFFLKNYLVMGRAVTKKQYNQEKGIVEALYKDDMVYRCAVESTINEFVQRFYNKKYSLVSKDIIFENCLNCLIEEITVVMRLMPEYGYNFIVYPNKIIEAFKVSHNIFIEPVSPHLMNWVHVQLKKTTSKKLKLLEVNYAN